MSSSIWNAVISALVQKNVTIENGLASEEFASAETQYDFVFPPDLREFLSLGLPVSEDFPNWRTGMMKRSSGTTPITEILDWPARGICFDVEKNGFWVRDWGPKPDVLQEAFQIARKMVEQAPPLIPIFSHRFLPANPRQRAIQYSPSTKQTSSTMDRIWHHTSLTSLSFPSQIRAMKSILLDEFDSGATSSTVLITFSTLAAVPRKKF